MEKKETMTFCYKGDRNYIHGTDIFNKIVKTISKLAGVEDFENLDMTIRKVATKNMDVYAEEAIPPGILPNVLFSLNDKSHNIRLALIENNNEVECRYPYLEDSISNAAIFHHEEQSIELKSFNKFSLIEQIVALNKGLLNALFPNPPGKWYFARIKLLSLNWNLWQKSNFKVLVKFKKNMQFRITDSIIFLDNEEIGHIYFSLVKNK